MGKFTGILEQAEALLVSAFTGIIPGGVGPGVVTDDDSIEALAVVERCGRLIDAARIATATDVALRSARGLGHDSLAWKRGCTNGMDLITRVTLISGREANRRVNLGGLTQPRTDVGISLPSLFPAVAAGLTNGGLGVEAAEIITSGLRKIAPRVAVDDLLTAERALVATATGTVTEETVGLPGAGVAVPTDLIRGQVLAWQARLDPDGVAPGDRTGEARSSFSFGTLRDGIYPFRGGATPEMRGVMDGIFNTHLSAHSNGAHSGPATVFPSEQDQARQQTDFDTRSGAAKRADILRMVLEALARDPGTPGMGGAAPTVMLHVNARDLADDNGVAWIDGVDAPASMRAAKQLICAGGYRKILFGDNGEVLYLGGKERFFSTRQRQALAARDGGCIIPGCPVAAAWTEVHHVIPWQQHGKTDIDNGVLLCWYHHASIDTSGWQIRIINGKPQTLAPAWIDPTHTWRDTTRHRANQPTTRPKPATLSRD